MFTIWLLSKTPSNTVLFFTSHNAHEVGQSINNSLATPPSTPQSTPASVLLPDFDSDQSRSRMKGYVVPTTY